MLQLFHNVIGDKKNITKILLLGDLIKFICIIDRASQVD